MRNVLVIAARLFKLSNIRELSENRVLLILLVVVDIIWQRVNEEVNSVRKSVRVRWPKGWRKRGNVF